MLSGPSGVSAAHVSSLLASAPMMDNHKDPLHFKITLSSSPVSQGRFLFLGVLFLESVCLCCLGGRYVDARPCTSRRPLLHTSSFCPFLQLSSLLVFSGALLLALFSSPKKRFQ